VEKKVGGSHLTNHKPTGGGKKKGEKVRAKLTRKKTIGKGGYFASDLEKRKPGGQFPSRGGQRWTDAVNRLTWS